MARLLLLPIAAVAIAAASRLVLLADAGNHFPWVTFLPAVTVVAVLGGGVAAIAATALSCLAVGFLWPWFSPDPFLEGPAGGASAALFALNGLALAAGGAWFRRARHRDRERLREVQRAAELVRASEARYRLLAENSHDVIWTLDLAAFRLTYVSPSIRHLRGLTVEEALAEPLEASLTPASLARVRASLAQVATGDGPDWSTDVYDQPCKDGSVKHVEITARAIRDARGVPVEIVGVSRDATARVLAQRALQESSARLLAIAHSFPNGSVVLFDREDRVLVAEGSVRFLGIEFDRLQGRTPREFASPEDAAALEDALRRARAGETVHSEHRIRGRVVGRTVSPVILPDAAPGSCVMVTQDVTDRRSMEAQLASASRLAAMGTLVAGVAHEINNPLGAVLASEGFISEEVELLRRQVRSDRPPAAAALAEKLDEIAGALADAEAGGRRVARIVKDLAMLGRPDSQRSRVRLANVLDEAMRWLPASIAGRAAIVREDLGPPDVLASEGQLVQVVVNLVTNASRAIPEGRRGTVTMRIGPGAPGMGRLEIRDDGAGMEPEVVERIFDPFYTTREVGEGTGLGLSVVHSIVTAHGGTVAVASSPGEGTTFGVEIPAAPERGERSAPDVEAAAVAGSPAAPRG